LLAVPHPESSNPFAQSPLAPETCLPLSQRPGLPVAIVSECRQEAQKSAHCESIKTERDHKNFGSKKLHCVKYPLKSLCIFCPRRLWRERNIHSTVHTLSMACLICIS
jgi:hypothetical protein